MWVAPVPRNLNVTSSWRRGGIGRFLFVGVDKSGSCLRRSIMVSGWNLYLENMSEADKSYSGFDLSLKLRGTRSLLAMRWCAAISMKADDTLSTNLKVRVSSLAYSRFKLYILHLEYIFRTRKFYNHNSSMYSSSKFSRQLWSQFWRQSSSQIL